MSGKPQRNPKLSILKASNNGLKFNLIKSLNEIIVLIIPMSANVQKIAQDLWKAADQLRANSELESYQYAPPILGLIFLRYADYRFKQVQAEATGRRVRGTKAKESLKDFYKAKGVLFLPEKAQYDYLLQLTDSDNRGEALSEAMELIETENPQLNGVLPKNDYKKIENKTLGTLLGYFSGGEDSNLNLENTEDILGNIYQYFMGEFARTAGKNGGQFFTPVSVVRAIVYVLEPTGGSIFDLACGGGGMFIESGRYAKNELGFNPARVITFYGQEKVLENVNLCKMNLGVHGLLGVSNISQGNTYYDDIYHCVGKADYVLANPPFNVDDVDKTNIKDNKQRFPFGMPRANNANYLWIQLFYTALSERGRAGFVMANSAGDGELEIRQELIKTGVVDVMISVASNMFYTVTLPCTLWFFDKGKINTPRKDKILFIDARNLYRQIDRKLREFKSGCVDKEELAQRFPILEQVEGLLVESPIDKSFWDWNEGLETPQQVEELLSPYVEILQQEVLSLVSNLYDFDGYEQIIKPFVSTPLLGDEPKEVKAAIKALVRMEALKKVDEDEENITIDLDNEKRVKAIERKIKELLVNLEEGKTENWLKKQTESYKQSAQKVILGFLLKRRLLIDNQRSFLPLDDRDSKASVGQVFAEDRENVIKFWQETQGTNHIKIIQDIVRSYRENEGNIESVAGLYKVADMIEIEEKGWSLNPGRYVGVAEREIVEDFEFLERLEELHEELERLDSERRVLKDRISDSVSQLLNL